METVTLALAVTTALFIVYDYGKTMGHKELVENIRKAVESGKTKCTVHVVSGVLEFEKEES
jgi:anti-sigma28 factor (negative regulator of flagellin synthesis)